MRSGGGTTLFAVDSRAALDVTQRVSEPFDVSPESARVRLIQLGYLRSEPS